jgi:O-antigen/teichoic acid export membrane protein
MSIPEDGTAGDLVAGSAGGVVVSPALMWVRGRWYRKLASSTFAANVATMLVGTVLGQAASVLLSPLLTRLYTPDQFGYLSVYTATLMILGVIAALRYELAIPIAASESELANLIAGSAIVLAGMTALIVLAFGVLSDHVLARLWLGPLSSHRILVPFGFACLGGYYVMVAAATRVSAFREIARTRISQGVLGPVSQILLGLFGAGASGLAIGFVIGQASGTFLLFSRVVLNAPHLRAAVSWRAILAALRRYVRFPLVASWAGLLDMAGSGTVLFPLFAACYSPEIAGYMFLSERVIARPLLMVSTSVLQVFTGEAGRMVRHDPATIRRRLGQLVPWQFALAGGWILLANLAAGWAFPVLFGQHWAAAIPYLRASSIAYLAQAVLHPVSPSLQIMERQGLAAAWQVGRLVLVIAGVVVAWQLGWPAVTALWLTSLVQAFACLTMLGLIAGCIRTLQQRQQR